MTNQTITMRGRSSDVRGATDDMKLVSVQVGRPRNVQWHGKPVSTGIYKESVAGRIMVHRFNLDGDQQADLTVHGGPDKAVYVYPVEHYATWAQELGRSSFSFGQFGENFTVQGMLEETVHVGDIFRIGDAQLEVTQPRLPCYKLGIKMDSMRFPKRFLASGRTGYYLRVIHEGEVGAGDSIERLKIDPERMRFSKRFASHFPSRETFRCSKRRFASGRCHKNGAACSKNSWR